MAVPIVGVDLENDPVAAGYAASLGRPGGNVTGASFFAGLLGSKRLELLRQLAPTATTIAMLVNLNNPEAEAEQNDVRAAAQGRRRCALIER